MKAWTEFGLRGLPSLSARTRAATFPPFLQPIFDAAAAALARPLVGISSDGNVRPGLFPLRATGVTTAPIVDAAQGFLATLDTAQRAKVVLGTEADERRMWFNIHPNIYRHGLMLEDLAPRQREAAMRLMQATLSARGFAQARDIMRLNDLMIEVTRRPDEYGEWPYFVTLFGTPSASEPWGWQLDGHHLNLNFFVLGDQVVMTPAFWGSEPTVATAGKYAGTSILADEQGRGLQMIRALTPEQQKQAIVQTSKTGNNILAQAFSDNLVLDYAGVRASSFSPAQKKQFLDL